MMRALWLVASLVGLWTTTSAAQTAGLEHFTPVRSITLRFSDGKFNTSRDQRAQLEQLAKEAQRIDGYMISIAAYAPAAGSGTDAQRMSMLRAQTIRATLQQNGVPLANVIVPAMKIDDSTDPAPKNQESRAIVTLLKNAGT
jgi:outer membrane protein OmpA-like peptidoglycan-associated protein